MEFLLIFNKSILPLFLTLTLAFVYYRIFKPNIKDIANLTLTVFAPIMTFEALVKHQIDPSTLILPIVFAFILTFALLAVAYLCYYIFKLNPSHKIPLVLSASMMNTGNFGLPLIFFTYGQDAEVYSIIYFIAFSIPLSTVAIYISSDKNSFLDIIKDILKIPIFHGLIAALVINFFEMSLPSSLDKSLSLLSQAAIPMMIFVLGLQLATIKLELGFLKIVGIATFIRLIVSPVLAFFILNLLGISSLEHNVALLQTSGPVAVLTLLYAIRFNRSPHLLSAVIFTTTIVSGLTLTVLIKLL
jgi:hypothetical protein